MISWSVIAMKNNLVVLSLLFYGLVVLLYNAFTINPGTCLEQHTELPAPQREQPLSERVDKEDENSSSFSAAEAGKPVAVKAGKHDDALVKKDEESILKGKDLYKKLCEKCHDAYSTKNTTGPGMQGILKKDLLPSSHQPATVRNILNQLNNPISKMPSFHFLSEEEKLLVISFLNTL